MNHKFSHAIILFATYFIGLTLVTFLCSQFILRPMYLYAKEYIQNQNTNSMDASSAAAFTEMLDNARQEKAAREEAALQAEQQPEEEPISDLNPVIAKSSISFPKKGDRYATITIDRIGMSVPLYYGDSKTELRKGAGQYIDQGSSSFGEGKQILVAGHNTKEFKPLQNAVVGDIVKVSTTYGEFAYTIVRIEVYHMNDPDSYNFNLDHEQLAMYTCYPFSGPPGKTERYFCYCDKLYGPTLISE